MNAPPQALPVDLPAFVQTFERRCRAQAFASSKEVYTAVRMYWTIGPKTARYLGRRRWLPGVTYRDDNRHARRVGLFEFFLGRRF